MLEISVGQALLLLIAAYKNNPDLCNDLKKKYLLGITSQKELLQINDMLAKSRFSDTYVISTDPVVINEDASRRYFETHLAFETLANTLNQLPLAVLTSHRDALLQLLPTEKQTFFHEYTNGIRKTSLDRFAQEYVDAITKIKHDASYSHLSEPEKNKLSLIMQCSWLAVMHNRAPFLPLNIYGSGLFAEQARGKVPKPETEPLSSTFHQHHMPHYSKHYGLMKQYMFVPKNDVAYVENGFDFIKPSDLNNMDVNAAWPKKNFSTMVHPFSCGISGTTLMQLRVIKYMYDHNNFSLNTFDIFCDYLKCFMSGLLFNSGGHGYNEFLAVLEIPEIRQGFTFMDDFKKITMEALLIHSNEPAFNKAIDDAVAYNHVLLAHKKFHSMLLNNYTHPHHPTQQHKPL